MSFLLEKAYRRLAKVLYLQHNLFIQPKGKFDNNNIYLTIDRIDVNLSLLWMLEGKGILRACKASGVRGFVDRRPEAQFYAAVSFILVLTMPISLFDNSRTPTLRTVHEEFDEGVILR